MLDNTLENLRKKTATSVIVHEPKGNTTGDRQGVTVCLYHSTEVVAFTADKIYLDNGGYETSTTKRRMNQMSEIFGLFYKVFAKNFSHHVETRAGVWEFAGNEITIDRRTMKVTSGAVEKRAI